MTCRIEESGESSAVELMAKRGLEGLPEALAALINEAMRLERERHWGVAPYARNVERRGYANGYTPKTMNTRIATACAPATPSSPSTRKSCAEPVSPPYSPVTLPASGLLPPLPWRSPRNGSPAKLTSI